MLDNYDPNGDPQYRIEMVLYPEGTRADPPLVVFDCGSFADPEAHFPDLRARTHLDILKVIGAAGAVIGAAELNLNAADAQAAFADPPVPLASCNLSVKLDGVKIGKFLQLCSGWYVVGVTAYEAIPGVAPAGWWELAEPVASVQTVLDALPEGAHVIVSALGQPPEVVAQLAGLPVDVVIGEPAGQAPRGGATVLPPPVPRITTLTMAQFTEGRTTPFTWSQELADYWLDDDQVLACLTSEQASARERLGLAKQVRKDGWKDNNFTMSGEYMPQAQPVYDYVGADACAACHAGAYQVWLKSAHSHALASLVAQNEQESLDCLECHTVALLDNGGYDPLEPRDAVSAVSCESCHGPGRAHAELMQGGGGAAAGGFSIDRGSVAGCLGCHDDFNSPEFEAQAYWEMIKH